MLDRVHHRGASSLVAIILQRRVLAELCLKLLQLLGAIVHDIVDGGSLFWVDDQHLVDDVQQLGRVARAAQRLVVCADDLAEKVVEGHLLRLLLEGTDEGAELIGNAAQAPNIALEVVATSLQNFG